MWKPNISRPVIIDMETKTRHSPRIEDLAELNEEVYPLAAAFDQMQDHIVITDENANIVYANKAVERQTGFSRAEIFGRNPGDLWGGKMPKDFYERMWYRIKIEKEPFVGQVLNITKDGTPYYQELRISPILDGSGEVKYFIGIEPNVTHQKLLEQSREKFLEVFSRRAQNTFASARSTLDWLSANGNLNQKEQERLEAVYRHEKNLAIIVSDLLAFLTNSAVAE